VTLDPRVNPYRPDLAAAALRGKVEADRFVDGVACQVRCGFASMKEKPDFAARQASEVLFGERFTVFEEKDGWAWGQNATDGYVGWVRLENLDDDLIESTHRIIALRSFLYPEPDVKYPFMDLLPMGCEVRIVNLHQGWAEIAGGGWLYAAHLAPLAQNADDAATIAQLYMGTPYLWGGRTSVGLDCSGLMQSALGMTGVACPRDSDQQAASLALGLHLPLDEGGGAPPALQRGDLVFFKGHVGMMLDEGTFIHANAFHMAVVAEPLNRVIERARDGNPQTGGPVAARRPVYSATS
jgi:NlpC/P60 family/Bacterial dipeptidyl-peptidase Sh3 domain